MHANVCGPIQQCSFDKNLYFLLFINDYSRRTRVYFLKEKSNVFNCSKKFKALVEKENGYFLKLLRTKRGWILWRSWYKETLTLPRSPQQNGVMEKE
jgi:hypothetical protein